MRPLSGPIVGTKGGQKGGARCELRGRWWRWRWPACKTKWSSKTCQERSKKEPAARGRMHAWAGCTVVACLMLSCYTTVRLFLDSPGLLHSQVPKKGKRI